MKYLLRYLITEFPLLSPQPALLTWNLGSIPHLLQSTAGKITAIIQSSYFKPCLSPHWTLSDTQYPLTCSKCLPFYSSNLLYLLMPFYLSNLVPPHSTSSPASCIPAFNMQYSTISLDVPLAPQIPCVHKLPHHFSPALLLFLMCFLT